MRRRPARCFYVLCGTALLAAGLAGCGHDRREGSEPPPIAATKTEEPAAPAQAPAKAPAETPSEAAPAPAPAPASPGAAKQAVAPAPEPAYTPGTSLPGAIPPAAPPTANAPAEAKPADSLQWMRDSQARQADYARRLDEAEVALAAADASAAQWERALLAFKNPFLARPQLSPEDAKAIQGMDGAARAKWAESKLADARAARNEAQKTLDALKASPPP